MVPSMEQGVRVFFQVICFILAGYLAYQQFQQYALNEDSSILGFRQFNKGPEDLYPAYTVCINSMDRGSIFRNDENFLNITQYPSRFIYNQILQGKCCNDKNIITKALKMEYEEVLDVDIKDYVMWKRTSNKVGNIINDWDVGSNGPLDTFYRSYQDPNMVCMTNKVRYSPDLYLKRDSLVFDAEKMWLDLMTRSSWLYYIVIDVFIHQPRSLIPMLNDPILRIDALQLEFLRNTSRFINVRVNQVEVLEKREDAQIPCNKSLTEFDLMYKDSVVKSIGCIPNYWKRFLNNSGIEKMDKTKIPNCNTKDQYLHASQYEPLYFQNGSKLFRQPCRQMTVSYDMSTSDISYKAGELGLTIYYGSENYKLFRNVQSYGIYDLTSQFGGIIGMFLGFSLMQAPLILQWVVAKVNFNLLINI